MMRALYRLRRSVALFLCPEMGVQAAPQGDDKVGFFDLDVVRRQIKLSKKSSRIGSRQALGWRSVPRVCLPGWLIHRAVAVSAGPLYRGGPAIVQRLERHVERLDDSPSRGRLAGLTRFAALWLMRSPNDGPQATLGQMSLDPSSPPMPDLLPVSGQESSRSGERE